MTNYRKDENENLSNKMMTYPDILRYMNKESANMFTEIKGVKKFIYNISLKIGIDLYAIELKKQFKYTNNAIESLQRMIILNKEYTYMCRVIEERMLNIETETSCLEREVDREKCNYETPSDQENQNNLSQHQINCNDINTAEDTSKTRKTLEEYLSRKQMLEQKSRQKSRKQMLQQEFWHYHFKAELTKPLIEIYITLLKPLQEKDIVKSVI